MGVTTSTPADNSIAKGIFFFVLKNYTVLEGGIFCGPCKDGLLLLAPPGLNNASAESAFCLHIAFMCSR